MELFKKITGALSDESEAVTTEDAHGLDMPDTHCTTPASPRPIIVTTAPILKKMKTKELLFYANATMGFSSTGVVVEEYYNCSSIGQLEVSQVEKGSPVQVFHERMEPRPFEMRPRSRKVLLSGGRLRMKFYFSVLS